MCLQKFQANVSNVTGVSYFTGVVDHDDVNSVPQTVTEKHKLNVPETMTEVLEVSDEEGECEDDQSSQLSTPDNHIVSYGLGLICFSR